MAVNRVRERAGRGAPSFGVFAYSPDAALVEIAGTAGFDFVVVDTEHAAHDPRDVERLVGVARRSGQAAFVRLGDPTPHSIGLALDVGASGIVFPHLEDAAAARELVAATRFPPRGHRSACRCSPATTYGAIGLEDYVATAGEEVWAIGMIESPGAVDRVEEIIDVAGLDAVLPGPSDLAVAYGVPGQLDHPRVAAAIERVVAAAAERPATEPALYLTSPSEATQWAERGVRIFVLSIDYLLVARAYARAMGGLRDAVGAARSGSAA
jgi:staphyloferrin B biosynthesis citrate synthase